jgi:acetyl esterase/lipase
MYTKGLLNRLAGAIAGGGFAAWNVEYRRVGLFGGGGGWPNTLIDVAAAVDHLTEIADVDTARVVLCGHSAGGHLAVWAAARSRLPAGSPGAAPAVLPLGAISLAGAVDLEQAAALGLGNGAVASFMGGLPAIYPERYGSASPLRLLPIGVPQVLVHGLGDAVVPPAMSESYAARAAAAGDSALYVPIEQMGHRQVTDPAGAAWPIIAGHLEAMLSS